MKRSLFFSALAAFLLFACTNKEKTEATTSDRSAKNLEAMHTVNKAFETGDASSIDSVVADNFVDHLPEGDKGRDSLKAFIPKVKQASPDMKLNVIQEFSNDDYVVGWYRWTGTGTGQMGMPVGPYDMQAIELVKFNSDGKAIEHWSFMEMRDVMKMMGGAGNTAPPPMEDTTNRK